MPLSDLANVQVSTSGAGLTLPGFGTPMILGAFGKTWPERYRTYSSLVGGVDADFAVGTPEYLAAQALFAQNPAPSQVVIGRGTRKPTQVFKITVPAVLDQVVTKFVITVDGVDYTFTSDATPTQAEVCDGMSTAMNAVPGLTMAEDGGKTYFTLTGVAGAWHRVYVHENAPGVTILGIEETTADPGGTGTAADLGEIATAGGGSGAAWYAPILIFKSKAIVSAAAAWVEAAKLLLIVASQESAIPGTAQAGATDVAATLQTAAYMRTHVLWEPDNGIFADAGLLGACLPLQPGTETWANKTPAGVPARNFTGTMLANLAAKNAGWVYSVAGRNLTEQGKTAGGEWIDQVRGIDALTVDMQGRIVLAIANAKKIPYTDRGAAVLESAMRASLTSFEPGGTNADKEAGLLAEGSSDVTMPKVSAQNQNDRSNRYFPGAKFTGNLSGAIHKIQINGTLTA